MYFCPTFLKIVTILSDFAIPYGISKIFNKWGSNTPSEKAQYKINIPEKLVNDAISKGLESVDIPVENNVPKSKHTKTN